MSEILIEEENTVYELDTECLKQKRNREFRKGTEIKSHVHTLDFVSNKNLVILFYIIWRVA